MLAQKLGISNIQIHRPHEAQEEGRLKCRCFLKGGTKYSWEEIWRQSVEQRLTERTSGDCHTWGSVSYTEPTPDTIADAKKYLLRGT
jgi:hypothetical protein